MCEVYGCALSSCRIIYPRNRHGNPIINPHGKYFVSLNLNGCRRKVHSDYVHVHVACWSMGAHLSLGKIGGQGPHMSLISTGGDR